MMPFVPRRLFDENGEGVAGGESSSGPRGKRRSVVPRGIISNAGPPPALSSSASPPSLSRPSLAFFAIFFSLLLLSTSTPFVSGFAAVGHAATRPRRNRAPPRPSRVAAVGVGARGDRRAAVLRAAGVEVSTPSPDEAAGMGIREWPQRVRRGRWTEDVPTGETVTRYVLDGTGVVEATTFGDDADDRRGGGGGGTKAERSRVGPGTLVEATGGVTLAWEVTSDDGDGGGEMIVLTPGFEEGGKLAGVALALIVLCGALVAGVGGGGG